MTIEERYSGYSDAALRMIIRCAARVLTAKDATPVALDAARRRHDAAEHELNRRHEFADFVAHLWPEGMR